MARSNFGRTLGTIREGAFLYYGWPLRLRRSEVNILWMEHQQIVLFGIGCLSDVDVVVSGINMGPIWVPMFIQELSRQLEGFWGHMPFLFDVGKCDLRVMPRTHGISTCGAVGSSVGRTVN